VGKIRSFWVLRPFCILLWALGCALLPSSQAAAGTLRFRCVSFEDAGDCASAEAQVQLTVSDPGNGLVRFDFENIGPDHRVGGSPPNLPAGQEEDPVFDADRVFSAVEPPSQNGVGPGELVALVFELSLGQTVDELERQLISGELRAGVHAIAFDSGGSESLVNVPEPSSLALTGLGLAALAARRSLGRGRRRGE
jgi:hypothetical protein